MNILQVIGVVASTYGGPSNAALGLASAFQSLGHESILASTAYGDPDHKVGRSAERAGSSHGKIRVFEGSWPRVWENSVPLYRELPAMLDWADFLHIHGQYRLPPLSAWALARRADTPFGIQPHGSLEPYDRARSSRYLKDAYDLAFGRRMYEQAEYVMFSSDSEAANAARLVAGSKALVTPLGVRVTDPAPPSDVHLVARLSAANRSDTYLYLGRYAEKKQPALLLAAWAESRARETGTLVLAGPDGALTRQELALRADDLGIADSTYIAGFVTAAEASWLYSKAGTFILPSLNENFAISVAEAMRAGCFVVLTTDVASSTHARLAGDAEILESAPLASSLAAAIDRASLRVTDAGSMANSAYAREHFTWERTASAALGRMPRQ